MDPQTNDFDWMEFFKNFSRHTCVPKADQKQLLEKFLV